MAVLRLNAKGNEIAIESIEIYRQWPACVDPDRP